MKHTNRVEERKKRVGRKRIRGKEIFFPLEITSPLCRLWGWTLCTESFDSGVLQNSGERKTNLPKLGINWPPFHFLLMLTF
jgi:hypothetical protein